MVGFFFACPCPRIRLTNHRLRRETDGRLVFFAWVVLERVARRAKANQAGGRGGEQAGLGKLEEEEGREEGWSGTVRRGLSQESGPVSRE